jgi:putative addiction module component (TIGR02574 family)
MTATAEELVNRALLLAPADRVELAERLWASLDDTMPPNQIERAWLEEIERREQSLLEGKTHLLAPAEAKERLRQKFGCV